MIQRMFHGNITSAALADQVAARFNERHTKTRLSSAGGTSLIQIGSPHGSPVTLNIADTPGGVLVTMSSDRDWLDKISDSGEMLERAASGKPLALLAMLPEIVAEMGKDNIAPAIWDAINDICGLTRALAGEENAPGNPIVCSYCQTPNPPQSQQCISCGAALPVDLPRICSKCGRGHTSDALFCQACGTRLLKG
jgi:ribosomal protein L40E